MNQIVLEIDASRRVANEHADAGDEEKGAEDVENEMEPLDQRDAEPDHHPAHDERAENSPDQDAMLRHAAGLGSR